MEPFAHPVGGEPGSAVRKLHAQFDQNSFIQPGGRHRFRRLGREYVASPEHGRQIGVSRGYVTVHSAGFHLENASLSWVLIRDPVKAMRMGLGLGYEVPRRNPAI